MTHNNQENNSTFLTPKILDAIDSVKQKKKKINVESIFHHIEKRVFLNADKNNIERPIVEPIKPNLIVNREIHSKYQSPFTEYCDITQYCDKQI